MNLKNLILPMMLLMFSCGKKEYKEKKSTLVFKGQQEYEVRVYKPIDGMYNFGVVSDILRITPNIGVEYEVEIDGFGCIQLRFLDGKRCELLLEQGDRVEVNYESSKIKISGSNAEGHNYLRDNYTSKGIGTLYGKVEPILINHISVESVNFDSINGALWRGLILPYREDTKKMVSSRSISTNYSAILDKTMYHASILVALNFYRNLLSGKRFNFKPSRYDSLNIMVELDKMYKSLDITSSKLPYYMLEQYYELKYKLSDKVPIEQTIEKYGKDCFGAFPYYLFLTDSMQLREFGSLFIEDLQSRKFSFNHEKMLSYLTEKFPDSEYVSIIKKMREQPVESSKEIMIINDTVSSLKELMQLPGIKGNYAYIDLWATWCLPCTHEFQFNDDVHKILALYKNIVTVYISVDDDRKLWENRANSFKLKGYNILASKALNEDIGKKAYNDKRILSIPRYLLVDAEGNIVNDNLPRPSQSLKLKPILDGIIK